MGCIHTYTHTNLVYNYTLSSVTFLLLRGSNVQSSLIPVGGYPSNIRQMRRVGGYPSNIIQMRCVGGYPSNIRQMRCVGGYPSNIGQMRCVGGYPSNHVLKYLIGVCTCVRMTYQILRLHFLWRCLSTTCPVHHFTSGCGHHMTTPSSVT